MVSRLLRSSHFLPDNLTPRFSVTDRGFRWHLTYVQLVELPSTMAPDNHFPLQVHPKAVQIFGRVMKKFLTILVFKRFRR